MRMHREWSVSWSTAGFQLWVQDYRMWRWLVEAGVDRLMDVAGHPCCGKGLGRLPGVDSVAYLLINWAGSVGYRNHAHVLTLPLTVDQAATLDPYWRGEIRDGNLTVNGVNEDGWEYQDARLVAVECPSCHVRIAADGRWVAQILEDHECEVE